jgi:hypothetical protein
MAKTVNIETEGGHPFYLEEGIQHVAKLVLAMINYAQYEYSPMYKEAVIAQFPNLFDKAGALSEALKESSPMDCVHFTDEEVYTLYTCYDLMGRLYVSNLYDKVMDELQQDNPAPHPPDTMKKIYQHTLSKIQPFLAGTELYALKTQTLPRLGIIKKRLDSLPILN